jgi:GT2 family glycosyltransferase
MKLAIVTVDYNNHQDTHDFLTSAKKLKFAKDVDVEIITVDNGSDEPLSGAVIQTGENLGFTGGYNRGIAYALASGADFIAVVNNDVLFPDSEVFTKLLRVLLQHPDVGIVAPKILFAPGYEFHKDRYSKEQLGKVIWYAGGTFDWNNVSSIHRGVDEVDTGEYDKTEETEFVSGCCFVARREVFVETGMFEDKLFAYFEDADFIQRVTKYKKYYCGQASICHKVSQSTGIGSKLTDYMLTRNRLYFGFKYATNKTKFALVREAVKFLIVGR